MSVYLERVAPGLNPGGLWVRICAGDELIAEHALGDPRTPNSSEPEAWGEEDGLVAGEAASKWGESRTFFYDGDTGVCIHTAIVMAEQVGSGLN